MKPATPTVEEMNTRRSQMFPTLTDAQVARIAPFGKEVSFDPGHILYEEGDYNVPFYVVLEGSIEVVHLRSGVEEPVAIEQVHEFTGEADVLSDRRALVRGKITEPTRLLRVERSRLRHLVQTDQELSEVLMRAFILRRMGLLAGQQGDVIIIGSRHSADTLRLEEFLTRNGHPHSYVDVDVDKDVQSLLDGFHVGIDDVPVLVCRGERVLKNPTNAAVAECLGFNTAIDIGIVRDVVVIGAGPAGLAAAVYAASEGLDVLVLESEAPGGQAGSSSKIENYLGFPTGISGQALAMRALTQAEKFGARIAITKSATRLECDTVPYRIGFDGDDAVWTRSVVIASGAQYRKLGVPDLARFEGVGVYYGATFVEAQRCESEDVIVVGGGNSAGQAAMYLSRSSSRVHIMVRGEGLSASMSRYLIRRIEETPNITLHVRTRVVGLAGGDHLEEVTWVDDATGEHQTAPIRHVFTMAGAKPNTEWLGGCLQLDDKGFVLTGGDLPKNLVFDTKSRPPYAFETSLPRVFAVGDVRSGSIKRVAAGVGEGSACIQIVHKVLAE